SFAEPALYPTGFDLGAVAAADFSGDGRPDLACAGFTATGGSVMILPGRGDGTFPSVGQPVVFGDVNEPVAADVNGDGRTDLVLDAFGRTATYLGLGDGTFRPPVVSVTPDGVPGEDDAFFNSHRSVGDFNGDGVPDLATIDDSLNARVLLGRGDGTFRPVPGGIQLGRYPDHILAADFNAHGPPAV